MAAGKEQPRRFVEVKSEEGVWEVRDDQGFGAVVSLHDSAAEAQYDAWQRSILAEANGGGR